jgi:uncharacterized membrane protein
MGRARLLFEIVSTVSAGLFTGAAIYINLVEHPARVECGVELALREFAPSYRRATVLQVTLAATGFLSAIAAWFMGASLWWLVGGSVLFLVIPFTLVVIFPTNKKLLDASLDRSSESASDLLRKWARLHAVRSVLSLTAFLIFVILLGHAAFKQF